MNSFDCVFVHEEVIDAQTKLVLKTDCNMQTKNHCCQFRKLDFVITKLDFVIHVIFVIRRVFLCMELTCKLELIYIYCKIDFVV